MRIVIIEDERLTAEDLKQTILDIDPAIQIIGMLKSVSEGVSWFENNPHPDLIFSDIELGDGLSFEILNNLRVPVIFCTAYNEYALDAFKANGVDYLLKPFTQKSVEQALSKFKNLLGVKQEDITRQYNSIKELLSASRSKQVSSLLIYQKDYVFPIKSCDIAVLKLENEIVSLITFDGTTYYPGKSLDELEGQLGEDFYRANRQYLINKNAVKKASSILSRKLSITLNVEVKDIITISREKSSSFLKWLSGNV